MDLGIVSKLSALVSGGQITPDDVIHYANYPDRVFTAQERASLMKLVKDMRNLIPKGRSDAAEYVNNGPGNAEYEAQFAAGLVRPTSLGFATESDMNKDWEGAYFGLYHPVELNPRLRLFANQLNTEVSLVRPTPQRNQSRPMFVTPGIDRDPDRTRLDGQLAQVSDQEITIINQLAQAREERARLLNPNAKLTQTQRVQIQPRVLALDQAIASYVAQIDLIRLQKRQLQGNAHRFNVEAPLTALPDGSNLSNDAQLEPAGEVKGNPDAESDWVNDAFEEVKAADEARQKQIDDDVESDNARMARGAVIAAGFGGALRSFVKHQTGNRQARMPGVDPFEGGSGGASGGNEHEIRAIANADPFDPLLNSNLNSAAQRQYLGGAVQAALGNVAASERAENWDADLFLPRPRVDAFADFGEIGNAPLELPGSLNASPFRPQPFVTPQLLQQAAAKIHWGANPLSTFSASASTSANGPPAAQIARLEEMYQQSNGFDQLANQYQTFGLANATAAEIANKASSVNVDATALVNGATVRNLVTGGTQSGSALAEAGSAADEAANLQSLIDGGNFYQPGSITVNLFGTDKKSAPAPGALPKGARSVARAIDNPRDPQNTGRWEGWIRSITEAQDTATAVKTIAAKLEQPGSFGLAELIGKAWMGGAAILGSALSNQLGQNATVRSEVGQIIGPANLPPMGGTGKRRRSVSSRGRGKGRGPHRGRGASAKRRRRQ
jgi:hypothetical protein